MKDKQVVSAWRFLTDRKAGPWAKLFLVFAVLYVIMPFDFVPDVVVVLGWLDDLGVVLGATSTLLMSLKRYREKAALAQRPAGAVGPRVVETQGSEVG